MNIDSTADIIEDIRNGKMVILMDDEDRENEGDLIIAATAVTPEAINFMASKARGLICLTLDEQRCEQLGLHAMVADNGCTYGTAFTVSIDAAQGISTGISAADRAHTIQLAVAADAQPADLVQPGHIFPLRARKGGVLTRAGHTEAGCDLARLAGFEAAAVIVEIMNEDGTMARRDDLLAFAAQHDLRIGTIADLIQHRMNTETTVTRIGEQPLPTVHGTFRMVTYEDRLSNAVHIALVAGDINPEQPVLARVHGIDPLRDLIGANYHGPTHWSLWSALEAVAREGTGVVVLVDNETSASALLNRAPQLMVPNTNNQRVFSDVGTGAQILRDLGVRKFRHLGASWRFVGLEGYNLQLIDSIPFNPCQD
ncbi:MULTISPECIES: bifunctional 3,4-dihydroxy-2-butanone-4-phosphate synthase/GTP cyclohydrolase II [unclassified Oceanobacter]|jgi:3,4-dihydroxy 2-butanone 4-phosphate synthase/GTP cyclohydrolase II|uniref:bifunctional 3,4-dihydroxy-2-butanone-4-phosphate synthase/GTP cyclohydrolase II n=2 Tax=Gammaproteobacteria TaxID=1236 RepID=UPI0026E18361|nr:MULTISPECIES: bifunctional 3,4-dihydroxy-2-butanone-4-phosphate synthase/GTP cyclohydrolase II [unclassified Oceanobacter]MDO6683099.1 bifunctional 3,4-dihydroxy-2-butanone-4-phosphate synthase/GTP cyclohydrolase II [Oceanobacter sp. 5_MG-2023]MDP2505906.1 bifunctional 3,4-dihydroxy-2-butanone-4-phosphate synthase/GTP cyclohydrolase II [Oceanobacter sp. 3_MG-2023]MDP2548364.1 bifunctional 3,4-dihydroxy-2-butanone-4-phosphate synthase/GTP cyclohydrolase II [Oceanobacter sp. 4_MG-2023]MDP26083